MAEERARRFQEDDEEQQGPTGFRAFVAARLGKYQDPAEIVLAVRTWLEHNKVRAIVYAALATLGFLVALGLGIWKTVEIRTRPTVAMAVAELDYGAYVQADRTCDRLLGFTSKKNSAALATIFFVKGVALANLTDVAWTKERQSYYRAAAGFLQMSENLGFPQDRAAEAYFYLGKCYYLAGDIVRARAPLMRSLELKVADPRSIYWYLANIALYETNPDFSAALEDCVRYSKAPTTAPLERAEGNLLKVVLLTRLGRLDEAETTLAATTDHDEIRVMRRFAQGGLDLEQARVLERRAQAVAQTTFFSNDTPSTPNAAPATLPVRPSAPAPIPDSRSDSSGSRVVGSGDSSGDSSGDGILPLPNSVPIVEPPAEGGEFPLPPTSLSRPVPVAARPSVHVFQHEFEAADVVSPVYRQMAYQVDDGATTTNATSPNTTSTTPSPRSQRTPARGPVSTTRIFTTPPESTDSTDTGSSTTSTTPTPPVPVSPAIEIVEVNENETLPTRPAPLPPSSAAELLVVDPITKAVAEARGAAIAKYEEAIASLAEVAILDQGDFAWAAAARLLTGIAYNELSKLRVGNDLDSAIGAFGELLQGYPHRPEATAAEFILAEIAQQNGDARGAMELYYRSLRQIQSESSYANAWFPRREFMTRGQLIFDRHVAAKDYTMAFEFLEAWRSILPESEYYRNGAYTVAKWAAELSQLAAAAIKDKHDDLARDARTKYRVAGAWFEKLSHYDFAEPHFVRLLWDSAEYYRQGWAYPNAITMYQRYLEYNIIERQFEAKLHIARLWMHLDYLDRAEQDLTQLLAEDSRHPLAATARLWLAKTLYEKKDWDAAQRVLAQNLYSDYAPGSTLYGDSLYLVGAIDYQKKDYPQATIRLEDAVLLHPNAPQAAEAHYTIALCHLANVARLQELRATTQLERPRTELQSQILAEYAVAGERFQSAERLLAARQDIANLDPSEQLLLRNSLFGIGLMLMRRSQYEEASLLYNSIASRYTSQPIALYALMHLAAASEKLGRFSDAQAAINHADHVLATLRATNALPPDFRFTDAEWETLLNFEKTILRVHDVPIPESKVAQNAP